MENALIFILFPYQYFSTILFKNILLSDFLKMSTILKLIVLSKMCIKSIFAENCGMLDDWLW